MPLLQLMQKLNEIERLLSPYGIRDVGDYAEVLVASALGGTRETSRVNKGFDVRAPRYGRIEVKCRRLSEDLRIEERVEIGAKKLEGFDYLAIVVFHFDFTVKGGVLVPYAIAWNFLEKKQWRRIRYSAAIGFDGALDISGKLRVAQMAGDK